MSQKVPDNAEEAALAILRGRRSRTRSAGCVGSLVLAFVMFIVAAVVGGGGGRLVEYLYEHHKIDDTAYRVLITLAVGSFFVLPIVGAVVGWRMARRDAREEDLPSTLHAMNTLERQMPMADRVKPQGFPVRRPDDAGD
jgi:nitrate/nitrite transporter NarK